MDSIQIFDIVNSLHPLREDFQGVYPCDKLYRILVKPGTCCIINTAPSSHRGEHWIAVMWFNSHQEYFDSYGLPPNPRIQRFLESTGYKTRYNRKRVQGLFSSTCGAHCIYFLYHRNKGTPMHHVIKNMNDKRVTNFVNGLYSSEHELTELLDSNIVNQLSFPSPSNLS